MSNIAKTAVVSGTATPGAKVSIGSQEVEADKTTGAWSMTVTGLAAGKNDLVVIQKIDGTEFDRKTVSATIVDGGGLFAVDQGPVELERGATTKVPFVVENRVSRTNTKGTVVLTAPDGATFSEQDTVQGSWRRVGNTAWNASTSIPLTNGRLSNDNTTLTFDADWTSERPADQQYRFMVDVATSADAPEGSSAMDFDVSGTSSTNDFRAQGSTTTTVGASVVDLVANIGSIDHAGKSAVISGTATPGAKVTIGDKSVDADPETGAWSITVNDLDRGTNPLHVVQEIDGEEHDSKDLDVVINDAAISGQDGTAVTLERGEVTSVESLFKTNGSISRPQGKVEFTAPEGTTFAEDQGTIEGSFKKPGEDAWTNAAMTLTNGVRSEDGTKYTYDFATTTTTWNLPDASLMRWNIDVDTPADAVADTSSMSATLVGTASEGAFNTTSTTATTVEAPAQTPLEAKVDSVDNVNKTAVVSGTATKGATVAIGDESVEVTNDDGSWTLTVGGLEYGDNTLHVVQTIGGQEFDSTDVVAKVDGINRDFTVATPENGSEHKGESVTFSGNGRAGETVRVHVTNFDSADVTAEVDDDGHWSVSRWIGTGMYVFDVTQTNAAGSLTGEVRGLTVNKPADEGSVNLPWAVTSPESGSEHRGEMVTWTGTGNAGDTVSFTPKNPEQSSWSTVVKNNGTWSVDHFAGTGAYDIDVVMKNAAGSVTGESKNVLLNQSVNLPFAVTSPESGTDHKGELVTFEGTGNADEEISLEVTNFDSSSPTPVRVDRTGHWKIEKFLGTGAYTIDITQKNLTSGAVTGEAKDLKFNQPSDEDPVDLPWAITSPESGSEHPR
ncbi:hypothetical protein [Curtobacterium sp. SL109]|uniref:hypothetical protein n=1 Tax=Curtobacterium sp. SL109 TaxID=2994662 RepID=UPI002272C49B|nr:hypothetical protein [Curtobacterium sp. SL109]MCY1694052.1 hypothetical protein [Curtobacterium sp. SL109]